MKRESITEEYVQTKVDVRGELNKRIEDKMKEYEILVEHGKVSRHDKEHFETKLKINTLIDLLEFMLMR